MKIAAVRPCASRRAKNLSEFAWRRSDKTCASSRERSSSLLEIKRERSAGAQERRAR